MSKDRNDSIDFDQRREEQREILYRLDERTERIDSRMERIDTRVEDQCGDISDNKKRITRNTMILNGITFGVGSIITAVLAKFNGLLGFLR
jgi:hypothetical protein